MTLSYCSLSSRSSASRVSERCWMMENVPSTPQATATVSEMARMRRAPIERSPNMGIPTVICREIAGKTLTSAQCVASNCGSRAEACHAMRSLQPLREVGLRATPARRLTLTSSACRRRLRLSGENGSAGILIMGVARLELLGDGVHVAKPPLERICGEDGGGAGHVIGGVDHCSRLMNGPGCGDAQRDAMRFGDRRAAFQIAPDLVRRRVEIGARRAQGRFGAANQALDRVVLAHRRQSLRQLGAGELDRGIKRGAGDAERGRGEAHAEHHMGGELVERALLANRGWIVAQSSELVGNKEILDRIGV